jgi:formylglycine-generating enzyme required for sulfatase activity
MTCPARGCDWYVTLAETPPDPADYPGMDRFPRRWCSCRRPARLASPHAWWPLVPGANWRRPSGTQSNPAGLDDHPVVHIAHTDAASYTRWAGKSLPTAPICVGLGHHSGEPQAFVLSCQDADSRSLNH